MAYTFEQSARDCLSEYHMHRYVIFTDLDGTLLDADTYSWAAATPALEALRASGILFLRKGSR